MRLAAASLALLALGLVLSVPVILIGAPPRIDIAYVALLVLGISAFVAAHYYKIVPFLIWYHRFGPLAGRRPVPKVAELYAARPAFVAALCIVSGAVGVTGAIAAGLAPVARVSALLLLAGVSIEAVQMLALARRAP
jgi:hypothetical protein